MTNCISLFSYLLTYPDFDGLSIGLELDMRLHAVKKTVQLQYSLKVLQPKPPELLPQLFVAYCTLDTSILDLSSTYRLLHPPQSQPAVIYLDIRENQKLVA